MIFPIFNGAARLQADGSGALSVTSGDELLVDGCQFSKALPGTFLPGCWEGCVPTTSLRVALEKCAAATGTLLPSEQSLATVATALCPLPLLV